jgi:ribulose-phosphate 3-epimerase
LIEFGLEDKAAIAAAPAGGLIPFDLQPRMTPESANVGKLRKARPAVLPSLLACDFGNLEREVRRLEEAGVPGLHLDVMDGHFVPNLTFGLPIVESLRRLTDLAVDVHLMIERPERYAEAFCRAGADLVTIHIEAAPEPLPIFERIREQGVGVGIALNPATPVETLAGCLDACDLVLAMSVPAGFGGQPFHEVALDKLRWLRDRVDERMMLEVDGGVNETTITRCAQAGAGYFVVGTGIFRSEDYVQATKRLIELVSSAPVGGRTA